MLHNISSLERCVLLATDGKVGTVKDVYFDDERWVVRYLVVDTGGWLTGHQVLISPYAVQLIDWPSKSILVNLTRERVERSPSIDTDKPVSRQQEAEYHRYYGYPAYWPHATIWPAGMMPSIAAAPDATLSSQRSAESHLPEPTGLEGSGDSHLRSSREVTGYGIEASDGAIGHVEDLLFDDESWAIRHFLIDTRNWLPGKQVLIEPVHIQSVDWPQRAVMLRLTRDEVKRSVPYDPGHLPAGDVEQALRRSSADDRHV
jgi:uncharacterized protein YrrD